MSPGRRGKRRSHTLHTRPAWWARQDSNLQPDRYERPEPMLGHASQRMLMNKYEHNFNTYPTIACMVFEGCPWLYTDLALTSHLRVGSAGCTYREERPMQAVISHSLIQRLAPSAASLIVS